MSFAQVDSGSFIPIRAFILVCRNAEGRWQIYRVFDHVPEQSFGMPPIFGHLACQAFLISRSPKYAISGVT